MVNEKVMMSTAEHAEICAHALHLALLELLIDERVFDRELSLGIDRVTLALQGGPDAT